MTNPPACTDMAVLQRMIRTLKSENAALRADPFGLDRAPPETPERIAIFRKIGKMSREFTKRNPSFEEWLQLQELVDESFKRMQDERYPSSTAAKNAQEDAR